MIRKNKGQISHAFTMIFFILVAGFVFFLGYAGINSFIGDSCDVQRTGLKADLERFFDIYDDYGSVHNERIVLPCGYQYVCFVDNTVYNNDTSNINFGSIPAGIGMDKHDVIETAEVETVNIFVVGEFAEPLGYSVKVTVDNPEKIICVQSPTNLRFEGQGRTTKVSEAS